jgi:predicted ArsR family transcriptional regulator
MPAGSNAAPHAGRSTPGGTVTNGTYHAALASPTRRRVLDILAGSAESLDAQGIASVLELHVSTVRFHLDQLEEARLVRREPGGDRRRGRPRVLYTAVHEAEGAEGSREQLIEVLAGALAGTDSDQGRSSAIRAGRGWARGLLAERSGSVDRRSGLLEVLDRLGFDPAPEGDAVRLRGCPFRDAARRHPQVVCSVHLGLVQQLLDGDHDGGGPPEVRLLPFVEPDLCVITLT